MHFRIPHSPFRAPRASRKGFTLVELVVFAAIFSISAVAFVGILVTVVRIQVRQSASAEVVSQSQFLLQTIQREIEKSAAVDIAADTPVSNLVLRAASGTDPVSISLSGGTVYLQTAGGASEPLTSNRVQVSELTFVKRVNPGGKDSVAVNFTVAYNTVNPQQAFTQFIDTSIARVSAATFDSDVRASADNLYKLGANAREWQSINNTLFFGAGSNVGIGGTPASSGVKFQVFGGNLALDSAGGGIVLRSAGGSCYLLTVTDDGQFATSSAACP